MSWPSVVTTFTNPTGANYLSTTPHSSIETAQNTDLTALETFIGTEASTVGTLFYDIRAAASNGGGHVQSANKGGTGQTAYTKGDILVATSSSVLSKLSVGSDNFALVGDSTQSTGLNYKAVLTATAVQNQQYTYARASVMSGSVYGVVLAQAVSILSDGLAVSVKFPTANTTSVLALSVNATGPSSVAALIKNRDNTNPIVGAIQASMIGALVFDSVSSVFQIQETYVPTYGTSTSTFLRNDATWSTPSSGTKLNVNTTSSTLSGTASETTIYSVSVPGGTLGTNNGVRGKLHFTYTKNSGSATTIKLKYGSTTIVAPSATANGTGSATSFSGYIDFVILGNGSTSAQVGSLSAWGQANQLEPAILTVVQMYLSDKGTAAEDSTTNLTLAITVTQNSGGDTWVTNHCYTDLIK